MKTVLIAALLLSIAFAPVAAATTEPTKVLKVKPVDPGVVLQTLPPLYFNCPGSGDGVDCQGCMDINGMCDPPGPSKHAWLWAEVTVTCKLHCDPPIEERVCRWHANIAHIPSRC